VPVAGIFVKKLQFTTNYLGLTTSGKLSTDLRFYIIVTIRLTEIGLIYIFLEKNVIGMNSAFDDFRSSCTMYDL